MLAGPDGAGVEAQLRVVIEANVGDDDIIRTFRPGTSLAPHRPHSVGLLGVRGPPQPGEALRQMLRVKGAGRGFGQVAGRVPAAPRPWQTPG